MPPQRRYILQLAGRAAVVLLVAYVLTLGGTYNGILLVPLQQASLVILTAGVVSWQLAAWRRPVKTGSTPLDPALALWGIAYAISALHNPSGRVTIGLWYAGLYTGVWFVLSDLRRRGLPGRWITDAALLTAIPLMILALVQVLAWFPAWLALEVKVAFVPPRPPSALGNPNALGAVLAMLLPLGLVRARWSSRRFDRFLWAWWVVSALGVLYLTYSRGAWLAAASALLTLAVLTLYRSGQMNPAAWWRAHPRRTRLQAALAAGIAVMIALVLLVAAFGEFNTPRRETGARFAFYEIAWQEFTRHPLTGTGPFTFGLSLLYHRSIPPDQPHAHAHDLVLNVAAEMGLPGLIALAATIMLVARHGRRALRSAEDTAAWAHTAACGAAFVALGVHSLVDMPVMFPAVMLLMLGILAAGIVQPGDEQTEIRQSKLERSVYRVLPLALWSAVLATGWWSARAYADYVRGERLLLDGAYQRGVDVLSEVARTDPNLALYDAEYAYACGLASFHGNDACLQRGIDAYRRALSLEAPHAVWWANLAVLYWQSGQRDRAVEAMRQATRYASDDPDLWLNLGAYYEAQGSVETARQVYRHVLELDARWGYSGFWSETALRQELLAAYPLEPTPYMRAETLWEAGQERSALAVLEATIDHDPTQPGPYVNIARLYVAAGELDRVQDYLDAARVLVHTDHDWAWIQFVEAELALARGDQVGWASHRQKARDLLWPDATGYPLVYGRDIALYQFLRLRVRGALLPQLVVLSPDPVLVELLGKPSFWYYSRARGKPLSPGPFPHPVEKGEHSR
jgi:tetratricopeptide (TPR) repeat protein/O-antigen ligase